MVTTGAIPAVPSSTCVLPTQGGRVSVAAWRPCTPAAGLPAARGPRGAPRQEPVRNPGRRAGARIWSSGSPVTWKLRVAVPSSTRPGPGGGAQSPQAVRATRVDVPAGSWSEGAGGVRATRSGVLRARMCLPVAGAQPLDGDVRVDLGGRQGRVAQDLLDAAQVGAAFQQVGGCGVAQAVRTGVRHTFCRGQPLVHHAPGRAWVQPSTPGAEQQRRAAVCGDQDGAAVLSPSLQGVIGWQPHRDGTLPATLTEHTNAAPFVIDVVDVETAEFTDPDGGRI